MTIQTPLQLVITIGIIALGTFLIRALPFSCFPPKRNAARCCLPRRSAPERLDRNARRLLFKMSLYFRFSWTAGAHQCRVRHCRPQMEAQPAALHRRRHGFIHAARAARFPVLA